MLDNVGKWVLYLAMVAGLLAIGWNEPLRYRFMSEQEIYDLEHPSVVPVSVVHAADAVAPAPATPAPGAWMWDSKRPSPLTPPDRIQRSRSGNGLR
ncbi:MAG: hypothetical protein V4710_07525 [Verrucomicrobiota bacterium]